MVTQRFLQPLLFWLPPCFSSQPEYFGPTLASRKRRRRKKKWRRKKRAIQSNSKNPPTPLPLQHDELPAPVGREKEQETTDLQSVLALPGEFQILNGQENLRPVLGFNLHLPEGPVIHNHQTFAIDSILYKEKKEEKEEKEEEKKRKRDKRQKTDKKDKRMFRQGQPSSGLICRPYL